MSYSTYMQDSVQAQHNKQIKKEARFAQLLLFRALCALTVKPAIKGE